MSPPDELRRGFEKLGALLAEVEALEGTGEAVLTRRIVRSLLDIHALGLRRMLRRIEEGGTTGRALVTAMAEDPAVEGLFLLYDLHPRPLEERVRAALDAVRPSLRAHGGDVDFVAIDEGMAKVRLLGACDGCSASAKTLSTTVEDAVYAAAPDLAGIELVNERDENEKAEPKQGPLLTLGRRPQGARLEGRS